MVWNDAQSEVYFFAWPGSEHRDALADSPKSPLPKMIAARRSGGRVDWRRRHFPLGWAK
jgi:hypothetical protein